MRICLKLFAFFTLLNSTLSVASELIREQIHNSSGFVEGHVSSVDSKHIIIQPARWLGIELAFDGTVVVGAEPALSFDLGEHVVLILDKKVGAHNLYDGASSAYSVRRVGARRLLVNKLKNLNPLQSQYGLLSFYKLVSATKLEKVNKRQENYKTILAKKRTQHQLKSSRRGIGRGIASVNEVNSKPKKKTNILWILLLMCSIAIVVRKLHREL